MVYFQTKYPNLGIFWRALECKMLVYFMTIWNIWQPFVISILWSFGKFYWPFTTFFTSLVSCTKKNLAILNNCETSRLSPKTNELSPKIPFVNANIYLKRPAHGRGSWTLISKILNQLICQVQKLTALINHSYQLVDDLNQCLIQMHLAFTWSQS
jgi:hypothetical protein